MEKELLQRFDEFVESVGEMGGYVFDVAVRQATVDGITALIGGVLALLLIPVVFVVRARWLKAAKNDPGPDDHEFSMFIAVVATVPTAIVGGWGFIAGLRRLLNPEWYALQEIAKSLGLQ